MGYIFMMIEGLDPGRSSDSADSMLFAVLDAPCFSPQEVLPGEAGHVTSGMAVLGQIALLEDAPHDYLRLKGRMMRFVRGLGERHDRDAIDMAGQQKTVAEHLFVGALHEDVDASEELHDMLRTNSQLLLPTIVQACARADVSPDTWIESHGLSPTHKLDMRMTYLDAIQEAKQEAGMPFSPHDNALLSASIALEQIVQNENIAEASILHAVPRLLHRASSEQKAAMLDRLFEALDWLNDNDYALSEDEFTALEITAFTCLGDMAVPPRQKEMLVDTLLSFIGSPAQSLMGRSAAYYTHNVPQFIRTIIDADVATLPNHSHKERTLIRSELMKGATLRLIEQGRWADATELMSHISHGPDWAQTLVAYASASGNVDALEPDCFSELAWPERSQFLGLVKKLVAAEAQEAATSLHKIIGSEQSLQQYEDFLFQSTRWLARQDEHRGRLAAVCIMQAAKRGDDSLLQQKAQVMALELGGDGTIISEADAVETTLRVKGASLPRLLAVCARLRMAASRGRLGFRKTDCQDLPNTPP